MGRQAGGLWVRCTAVAGGRNSHVMAENKKRDGIIAAGKRLLGCRINRYALRRAHTDHEHVRRTFVYDSSSLYG